MTTPAAGASGAEDGLDGLRRDYCHLVNRFGGIRPALVAIASMLDIPGVEAREGYRPSVVLLLLKAAEILKAPPDTIPVEAP